MIGLEYSDSHMTTGEAEEAWGVGGGMSVCGLVRLLARNGLVVAVLVHLHEAALLP